MIETETAVERKVIGEISQAIIWFKQNGVHAWQDDGSVYIEVDNDNFEVFNVQVGTSEVIYRADLYRNENMESNNEECRRNTMNSEEQKKGAEECMESQNKMMNDIQKLVNEQAEDEGLWFEAETAPEAYLQQELRRLHYAIENSNKEK